MAPEHKFVALLTRVRIPALNLKDTSEYIETVYVNVAHIRTFSKDLLSSHGDTTIEFVDGTKLNVTGSIEQIHHLV